MYRIYTIGHSNHKIEAFIQLLKQHGITAVCDVRSTPYSKYTPQFNYESLKQELKKTSIEYVFLGTELGPRREDPACYLNGKVQYNLLAKTSAFKEGLARVKKGVETYAMALMCAEKDPVVCHRTILVCRQLKRMDFDINHILDDGRLESNRDTERRLMKMLKIPGLTLFDKPEDLVEQAYDKQGDRIAYTVQNESQDEMEGGIS